MTASINTVSLSQPFAGWVIHWKFGAPLNHLLNINLGNNNKPVLIIVY
jgi:hypothetical protein